MARGDFPSSKQDQFVLRFPEGMRDRIKAAAERNNRSMNAEIVAALEEAFPEVMEVGEYIQTWVVPIMNAATKEEKDRLVQVANRAGAEAGVEFRVRMSERPDGRYAPEIVSAHHGTTLLYIG
jgi:hypothetical protein